jgi:hypothetical protein
VTADTPEMEEEYSNPRLGVHAWRERLVDGSSDGIVVYKLQLGLDLPSENFEALLADGWEPVHRATDAPDWVPEDVFDDEDDEPVLVNTVVLYTINKRAAYRAPFAAFSPDGSYVTGAKMWATAETYDAVIDKVWKLES